MTASRQRFRGWLLALGVVLAAGLAVAGTWAAPRPPEPEAPARATSLRAGVARVDITPPLEMKAALGGYGDRMSRPATGVHDRIWAKALWLTDGRSNVVLVSVDALCFPPPVRKAVWEKLRAAQVRLDEMLLLPSHSHNSFDLMALHPDNVFAIPQMGVFHQAAFDHVTAKLAEVITAAGQTLEPIHVGTGQKQLPGWHRNRRSATGVVDPELLLTRFDRVAGSPFAVLVNWAAHPTFLGPQDMLFSGDWPGSLQRCLEEFIGQGVTVLYANGAQGDLSPTPRPGAGQRWEQVEAYGRGLALECHKLWRDIRTQPENDLQHHRESITLPPRKKHQDFMKIGGKEYGLLDQGLELMLHRLFPTTTDSVSVRIGPLVIVGVPGEMAAGLGLEVKNQVKRETRAAFVAIGGLANEGISYILSPEEYRRGGYEATISFYGDELGPAIVTGVVRGAKALGR